MGSGGTPRNRRGPSGTPWIGTWSASPWPTRCRSTAFLWALAVHRGVQPRLIPCSGSKPSTVEIPWPRFPTVTGSCAWRLRSPEIPKRSSRPSTASGTGTTAGAPRGAAHAHPTRAHAPLALHWLLDVDEGTSRLWFDLNEKDRYASPGYPLHRPLPNGRWVLHQQGDAVYFSGGGATEQGDRPFLDLRHMETGEVERLFRSDPERYEYFVDFAGDENHFVLSSESAKDVPNYYLATLGKKIEVPEGEATRALTREPITQFEDPTPQLREIENASFSTNAGMEFPSASTCICRPAIRRDTFTHGSLRLSPGYSDPSTAGQVSGSVQRFSRIYGPSHRFFLLRGYAVLDRTAMPMIGDPRPPTTLSCPSSWPMPRRPSPRPSRWGWPIPTASGSSGTVTAGSWWPTCWLTRIFSGRHRPQRTLQQDQPAFRFPVRAPFPFRSSRHLHPGLAHLLRRQGQRAGAHHPWRRRLQPRHPHPSVGGFLRGRARFGRHRPVWCCRPSRITAIGPGRVWSMFSGSSCGGSTVRERSGAPGED